MGNVDLVPPPAFFPFLGSHVAFSCHVSLSLSLFFGLQSRGLLYFLHLSCHEFIGNGFHQLRLLSAGPHVSSSGTSVEPKSLSLRLLFLMIFLHMLHEAISALRMLNMLNMPIHSLGNNLALNLSTIMPTASWVMLLTFPVLPCFNIHGAFFLAQCPSP